MGIFDDFKKKDSGLIEELYKKVDTLSEPELAGVLAAGFLLIADNGFGALAPFPPLVRKVNKTLQIDFEPKTRADVLEWMKKVNGLPEELRRTLLVQICFDSVKIGIISQKVMLSKIDELTKEVRSAGISFESITAEHNKKGN